MIQVALMELVSAKGVFLECILGQVAMEPPESPKGPNGGGECCAPCLDSLVKQNNV